MRSIEYCTMILLSKTSQNLPMFHYWNQAFWNVGFLWFSPNANSSWCGVWHEGLLIWPYHHITHFQLADVQVIWSWHHHLSIWALLSVIRGLAIAGLLWMLDLRSSRRTVFFLQTGSSRWIFSSAVLLPVLQ
jgi:hypothetical protein